ncbi:MAG: 6-phosphogluconolactonase [Anaerolineae bacterium]
MRVLVQREGIDRQVVVVPDAAALAQEAAGRFFEQARAAVESHGRFSVALSGGSTPEGTYRLLASEPYRDQIPWDRVHLFWGDERCVPPDDPGSNYRLADQVLISRVPIPAGNVHRMPGELAPEAAARAYRRELEEFFCGPVPRLDLVLLGLGSDGHTASLFPGADALEEVTDMVVAVEADYEGRPAQRVTLTLPAINAARQVLFLVSGESKAGIVAQVLGSRTGPLPAERVCPTAGDVTWLLDEAAVSELAEE